MTPEIAWLAQCSLWIKRARCKRVKVATIPNDLFFVILRGFPDGSVVKNLPAKVGHVG